MWGGGTVPVAFGRLAPREIFFVILASFFVVFLCCFLVLFFVRFLVFWGCHVGAFLEAKSGQNASFFWFFFCVVFVFVFGSFWGAILGRFGRQNWVKMCTCDFVIFFAFH